MGGAGRLVKVRDEMTLWVEEEGGVTSSRKRMKKESVKTTMTTSRMKKASMSRNTSSMLTSTNPSIDTPSTKSTGVQITERDLEVLGWIADQYAVRTDVIRWLLGEGRALSDSRTRAIVARWQRAGLVESRRFFAGAPNVVWPTRAGINLVRPGWRSRPPNLALLAHHHAVSQVRLAIEQRGHGTDWVCERVLYKKRSTHDAHVADGTFLSTKGPVTAVEVELTLKSADRLRDIVRDLTLDHEAVLYVVGTATIGTAVETAAHACASADQVHVVDLARMAVDHG